MALLAFSRPGIATDNLNFVSLQLQKSHEKPLQLQRNENLRLSAVVPGRKNAGSAHWFLLKEELKELTNCIFLSQ